MKLGNRNYKAQLGSGITIFNQCVFMDLAELHLVFTSLRVNFCIYHIHLNGVCRNPCACRQNNPIQM